METLHGNYIEIGNEIYLLTWVSPKTKRQLDRSKTRIDYLQYAVASFIRLSDYLSRRVDDNTSEFQHIVIANYREISRGISNAEVLLRCGELADSLTLLRPVLEYLLDGTYLKMYPEMLHSYEGKVKEHNAQIADRTTKSRDPNYRMRFINIKTMNAKIHKHKSCTDVHRKMIEQYNLLSNVAEHASPERTNLFLKGKVDWENTIGQFELIAFYVAEHILTVDEELYGIIERDEELTSSLKDLRASLYFMIEDDTVPLETIGATLTPITKVGDNVVRRGTGPKNAPPKADTSGKPPGANPPKPKPSSEER